MGFGQTSFVEQKPDFLFCDVVIVAQPISDQQHVCWKARHNPSFQTPQYLHPFTASISAPKFLENFVVFGIYVTQCAGILGECAFEVGHACPELELEGMAVLHGAAH